MLRYRYNYIQVNKVFDILIIHLSSFNMHKDPVADLAVRMMSA